MLPFQHETGPRFAASTAKAPDGLAGTKLPAFWRRVVAVWLGLLALAVLNGAAREAVLVPWLGRSPALLASGAILVVLVLLIAFATTGWMAPASRRHAWSAGALWVALTLCFELAFGTLVRHRSLSDLLAAYRFEDADLWPLVLAVVLVAPRVAYFWRRE